MTLPSRLALLFRGSAITVTDDPTHDATIIDVNAGGLPSAAGKTAGEVLALTADGDASSASWSPQTASGGSGTILPWATGTAYVRGQPVTNSGHTYTANDAHTAGATFVGDLGAHWTLLPVTKGDVGLGNVDNTSDSSKPVSTAQASAIDAAVAAALVDVSAGVLPGGAGVYVSQDQPTSPFLPSIWIPLDDGYQPIGGNDWARHAQFFTGPAIIPGSPEAVFGGSDLLGWWDAPSMTGFSDGDSATTMLEVTGNSLNLVSAYDQAAALPVYKTAIQNGKPIARFTRASPSALRSSNYPTPFTAITQPYEMWVVFRQRALTGGINIADTDAQSGVNTNSTPTLDLLGRGSHLLYDTTLMAAWHTWQFIVNGASSKIVCDGTTLLTGNAGTGSFNNWINLGSINGSSGSDMDLGSFAFAKRLSTGPEASTLLSYFQSVWGTTAP